jgi:branched-chain amino acid transport system substrate-binding protein
MKLFNLFITSYILYTLPVQFVVEAQATTHPELRDSTINIGLLIQDNNSQVAIKAAGMAIDIANNKGGFGGKPFRLVIRSMEGPWGTGSKQAVDLIFEENVWAIMGSHDGRNAHLVEQVTTKARIVFLSAWSGDPTLAQAFVPWYFTCVPTDLQQADAFINEIYNRRKLTGIASVSDNGYDSKLAMKSLMKKIKTAGKTEPVQLFYDNTDQDFNDILDKIKKAGSEAIILFGRPSASLKFIGKMEKRKMNQTVFGAISILNEDESTMHEQEDYRNVMLFVSGNWSSPKGMAFRKEYQRLYGNVPGAVAAYSYDGMSMLIEAVRSAGLDREGIRNALTKIQYEGVTGRIQFDEKGKRIGIPNLVEIENGIPAGRGQGKPGEN